MEFHNLADNDTSEAWESVRNEWISGFVGDDEEKLAGLELFNQNTFDDLERHAKVFETAEAHRIWGEFNIEPYLLIGDDFNVSLRVARAIVNLNDGPTSSMNLVETFVSEKDRRDELPQSATSYVAINCPRCELTAISSRGFDEEERPWGDDEGWVDPECLACSGVGEWEWSLHEGHGKWRKEQRTVEQVNFNVAPNHCNACANPLTGGAKFCSSCGLQVNSGPAFCRHCGAKRTELAKFCTQCGSDLQ